MILSRVTFSNLRSQNVMTMSKVVRMYASKKKGVPDGLNSAASKSFDKYASYHPHALSLQQLLNFGTKTGTEASSFEFLRQELPVRLANIMKEFNLLPDILLQMPSVAMVRNWYQLSFTDILEFENVANPEDNETLSRFADILCSMRKRHTNVVETMARGVMELRNAYSDTRTDSQIQYFLDRFYTNRISIRMLINQHVLLYGTDVADHPQCIGCIDPYCDVLEVVKDAYTDARNMCERYYLMSPDVQIESHNPYEATDQLRLVYVPSHLYHMLFELLKNSMRAVVERHGDELELPPLKISVCKGKEDLTIKLSDEGGGIPYSSRLYARYFQGDLVLNSIEGHGMDALIYLKVLSDEANECLPVYNKTASKVYESDVPVSDWSSPTPWSQNPSRSFSTFSRRTFNNYENIRTK